MGAWWFIFLLLLAVSGSQYAAHERRLHLLERKVAFVLRRLGADTAAIEAEFQQAEEAARQQRARRERRTLLAGAVCTLPGAAVGAAVLGFFPALGAQAVESAVIGGLIGGAAGFLLGCALYVMLAKHRA